MDDSFAGYLFKMHKGFRTNVCDPYIVILFLILFDFVTNSNPITPYCLNITGVDSGALQFTRFYNNISNVLNSLRILILSCTQTSKSKNE
jgi:hypothetical protein